MSVETKIFILICLSIMGIGILFYESKRERIALWIVCIGGIFGGVTVGGLIVLGAGSIAPQDKQSTVMVCVAIFLAFMPLLVMFAGRGTKKHPDPHPNQHGNQCDCWSCKSQ